MSQERPKQKIKRRKVKFSLEAAEAKEVILMGDFNDWNPEKHPMQSVGNGVWNKTVMLPVGTYEYKFLIDGDWKLDPQNNHICPNCFGSQNNIINLALMNS